MGLRVVIFLLKSGVSGVFFGLMAVGAQLIIWAFQSCTMGVVTIATAEPGGVHLTLKKRAVLIDFVLNLAVRKIQSGAQSVWHEVVVKGAAVGIFRAHLISPCVASSAGLNFGRLTAFQANNETL